jgi:NAD(P)H dehydrogenase (quinone)
MSNDTPILVTGVPGNIGSVGGSVVKLLRERDLPFRALVLHLDERSQTFIKEFKTGVEVVVADLTNGADVVRALHGCKRMYFGMSVSSPYLQATVIAAAAREIPDFEILVNISQMTVSQMSLTEMTESPQQQQHWLAEQVLNWSGVPVVHVRSTVFQHGGLINRHRPNNQIAIWLGSNFTNFCERCGKGHFRNFRRSHQSPGEGL